MSVAVAGDDDDDAIINVAASTASLHARRCSAASRSGIGGGSAAGTSSFCSGRAIVGREWSSPNRKKKLVVILLFSTFCTSSFFGEILFPSIWVSRSREPGKKKRDGPVTSPSPSSMAIESSCSSESRRRSSSHGDALDARAAREERRSIGGDLVVAVVDDDLFCRRVGLPPCQVGGRAPGPGGRRVPGARAIEIESVLQALKRKQRRKDFNGDRSIDRERTTFQAAQPSRPFLLSLSLHLHRPRNPPRPSGASPSASGRRVPSKVGKKEKLLLPRLAGRRSSAPRPAPWPVPLLPRPTLLPPLLPPLLLLRPCSGPLRSRSRRGSTPRVWS